MKTDDIRSRTASPRMQERLRRHLPTIAKFLAAWCPVEGISPERAVVLLGARRELAPYIDLPPAEQLAGVPDPLIAASEGSRFLHTLREKGHGAMAVDFAELLAPAAKGWVRVIVFEGNRQALFVATPVRSNPPQGRRRGAS